MKIVWCLICLVAAAVARGETIEISTSGWCGSGTRQKWSFHGLGQTAGAAEFKTGAWINSPRWPEANVLSAAVTLACSTNEPTRFLQVKFLYDDGKPVGPVKFDAVARAGTFETQVIDVNPARVARGIALTVPEDGDGDWSVRGISLAYAGSLANAATCLPRGLLLSIR